MASTISYLETEEMNFSGTRPSKEARIGPNKLGPELVSLTN